jgi:ankyrin repeat protein
LSFSYPCPLTVRLLIGCGANVDVLDVHRNTPLHLVVQNNDVPEKVVPVVDILCQAGAHMDHVNSGGETPLELVASDQNEVLQHLKETMGVRPLKCLCARLVQREDLHYETMLPCALITYVQKH